MIIVCLVLVVAAFVVIGVALALAELTLVNIALALGGLSAVLLAVEFVRNRKTLFGPGRAAALPDHRNARLHGAMTGQARTDGLGKASVPPPSMVAATGQVAPVADVGGLPVAVQGTGDPDTTVPAPVAEPVREAFSPASPGASGAVGSDAAEPHGSTAADGPEADHSDDAVPQRTAAAAEDAGTDGSGAPDEAPEHSRDGDVDDTGAAEADTGAEEAADDDADPDATMTMPVPVGLHGATAVDADETASADDDTDPGSSDDAEDLGEITFREPAEWSPPFALPTREQSESKNVSAAAIAALAARWTPTGADLDSPGTDADAAEEPDGGRPTGSAGTDTSRDGTAAKDPDAAD